MGAVQTLCVSFFLVTASMSCASAMKSRKLDPFSSVVVCGVFDVGIQPSEGNIYTASFLGDETQFPSMEASVVNSVLYIQNPGEIRTNKGVAMIINAPSDSLKSLETKESVGNVVIMPGFSSDTFTVIAGGTGDISAQLDVKGQLNVDSRSRQVGNMYVSGSSGSLVMVSKGTGDVNIFGLLGNAKLNVAGTGDVYIGGGSDTIVSGTSDSLNPILYSGKSCTIPGGFFGPACQRIRARKVPPISLPDGNGSIQSGASTCIKTPYF